MSLWKKIRHCSQTRKIFLEKVSFITVKEPKQATLNIAVAEEDKVSKN